MFFVGFSSTHTIVSLMLQAAMEREKKEGGEKSPVVPLPFPGSDGPVELLLIFTHSCWNLSWRKKYERDKGSTTPSFARFLGIKSALLSRSLLASVSHLSIRRRRSKDGCMRILYLDAHCTCAHGAGETNVIKGMQPRINEAAEEQGEEGGRNYYHR